jgi:hypothetical protein
VTGKRQPQPLPLPSLQPPVPGEQIKTSFKKKKFIRVKIGNFTKIVANNIPYMDKPEK